MGIFLLWATWVHEYMDIFVNIDGHHTKRWRYVILTKLGQHVSEMMAVAVNTFLYF